MKKNKQQAQRKSRNRPLNVPRGIPTITNGRGLQFGFPNRLLTKVRYADTYQITSTAGSIAKQVMRMNSTFDPDYTSAGHQPLYRDTFAAIYDEYAVVSADIVVTFVSNASTSAMVVGVLVDDDGSVGTNLNTLREQSNGETHLIPNATGSLSTHTFKYHWDCKRILQIDPFSSESYKTNVGSNPNFESLLVIYAAPADGASTTTTTVQVVLEQTVLWTELATPTTS